MLPDRLEALLSSVPTTVAYVTNADLAQDWRTKLLVLSSGSYDLISELVRGAS